MRLTADNLAARRGEDLIFREISFALSAGEAMVLTGRNGSGKSTLLRVIAGLLRPEAGSATFYSRESLPLPAREASHYLGHRNAMKNELTAKAESFARSGFTPMISAAMSMSRIAIHLRPTVPRVRFRATQASTRTKPRQKR